VIAGETGDESLVGLLASLAAETSQITSHDDLTVDDNDMMMSQVMLPLSAEQQKEIVEESLEMSQRVWDESECLEMSQRVWDEDVPQTSAAADAELYVLM